MKSFKAVGPSFYARSSSLPSAPNGDRRVQIELSAINHDYLDSSNVRTGQPQAIAAIHLSINIAPMADTNHRYKTCIIHDIGINPQDDLIKMMAFTVLIQRTKSYCVRKQLNHLAVPLPKPGPGAQWLKNLLHSGGFRSCKCWRPPQVLDGSCLCISFSSPFERSTTNIEKDDTLNEKEATTDLQSQNSTPHQKYRTAMVGAQSLPEKPSSDTLQPQIDDIISKAAASASPPRQIGSSGRFGKKEYCTHWIRTGECDYMQEGCRYKHQIPSDEETRRKIGLRTLPQWLIESHRPSPLEKILASNYTKRLQGVGEDEPEEGRLTPEGVTKGTEAPKKRSNSRHIPAWAGQPNALEARKTLSPSLEEGSQALTCSHTRHLTATQPAAPGSGLRGRRGSHRDGTDGSSEIPTKKKFRASHPRKRRYGLEC